jgi:hypothetical protein
MLAIDGRSIAFTGLERIAIDGSLGNDAVMVTGALPFTPTFNGLAGDDSLTFEAGSYTFAGDLGAASPNLRLVANGTAHLEFAASQHLASLVLGDQATATLNADDPVLLRTSLLSMSDQARLDLTDNSLILDSAQADPTSQLAALSSFIASARNAGAWNAPGVSSSVASGDSTRLSGLAILLNANPAGNPIHAAFAGEAVDADSILLRYTYNGDVDLNGSVDADDYFAVDSGFSAAATGYQNGDLDFSGAVDADDYFLIDSAFAGQSSPLAEIGKARGRTGRHHRSPRG